MKAANSIIICLFVCFYSCNKTNEEINSKLINLKDAEVIKDHHVLREFIENIEVIPLETSSRVVVGFSKRLIMTTDRIYIYDYKSKAVHIFNHNGDFINTLCRVGNGPNEYNTFKGFFVDDNDNLSILSYRKILKFDKDLNFISNVKIPDRGSVDDFIDFKDGKYCLIQNSNKDSKQKSFLVCMNKGDVVKTIGKSLGKDVSKQRAIRYGNTYNIIPSYYSNNVLSIDGDFNVTENYTVLFGEDDCAKKTPIVRRPQEGLQNYQIHEFIETGEFITFKYQDAPVHHCVYNKLTNTCFKGVKILTNKEHGFPLSVDNISQDGNFLIGIMSCLNLSKYIEDIRTEAFFNKEELEKLKNIKIDDNPVVFKIKLKSQNAN